MCFRRKIDRSQSHIGFLKNEGAHNRLLTIYVFRILSESFKHLSKLGPIL